MLNKTVWLLWLQGWDSTPWLIKQVAESWKINNPHWEVKLLSLDDVKEYVSDIDYIYDEKKKIDPQHLADIIRLSLLKNHGGVWADATMLCMQPLDTWIHSAVEPAGMWMFHGHGAGMSCSDGPAIWLIASAKESLMIERWKRACDEYWKSRTSTDEYYWLDGLFKNLFEEDQEFRQQWALAPYLYCESRGQGHTLAPYNFPMASSHQEIKNHLRDTPPYALKLWWKGWEDSFPDIESAECKHSNGYYAIQMSKRCFISAHVMKRKKGLKFRIEVFLLDGIYAFKKNKLELLLFFNRGTRKIKYYLVRFFNKLSTI